MFSWYARGFYQQSRKGTDSNIVDVSDTIISLVSIQKKWKWPVILQHLPENDVYKGCCKMSLSLILSCLTMIGPLQLAIHVVQNHHTGEQKSRWDKTNKENYHLKLYMSFVCLVPVQLLLSSVVVLHHVNG